MHLPLAGELHARDRILGSAGQFGVALLVLAAWNRQLRGKVPNGVVLSTSWLLLSTGLGERVLWRAGKRRKGFGNNAGADRCLSRGCPAAGWGRNWLECSYEQDRAMRALCSLGI